MSTIHRSRTSPVGIVAVLAFALSSPIAAYAEDQLLPTEEQVLAPAVVPGPSIEVRRVDAAQQALLSGDLGSMQEEALMAVVAAAMTWDESSGYGAVETSRAAASALYAPVAGPSWDDISGYGAVETSRATIGHPAASTTVETNRVYAAQQALLSGDIGSMQEEALTIVVATGTASDAPRIADDLSTALALGRRAESTHLATVLLPGEDAVTAEYEAAAGTIDEAALLAQFRAVELSLGRNLGAEQQVPSCTIES